MKKGKKVWIILGIVVVVVFVFLCFFIPFFTAHWIPGKYAIKESDFQNYEPYILVQEVHYTGTGWVQVGDETGYFLPEEYIDINLVNGNVLPQMDMYQQEYVNTFLCKVENKGNIKHDAFEEEIASYDIVEWYPVYPILRDTILPNWMYPKEFMTKQELGVQKNENTEK